MKETIWARFEEILRNIQAEARKLVPYKNIENKGYFLSGFCYSNNFNTNNTLSPKQMGWLK